MVAFPAIFVVAQSSELTVYILPALGLVLILYGVYQVITESKTSVKKRMRDRLRREPRSREENLSPSILRRGALGASKTIADAVIGKFAFTPKLQAMLDQADLDWSASQTLMNVCGAAVVTTVGLLLLGVGSIVAVGAGFGALMLPFAWLSFRRKRRQAKLNAQLPDVFEMMSQALRAGHSIAGAIQMIYEQMPPPISREFAQVYHEQNLGVKVEDALQAMAQRVESLDVKLFVTAVMIQRQTGGDLAEVLDNISGVVRERIELAGLVRGLTAEGRLSGWVLFALPGLIFVATLYLNPEYAGVLIEDPRGQLLLIVAGGMQLMGIAMIRWIVNIKV